MTDKKKNTLSIVIVNYNTPQLTMRSVESCLQNIDSQCTVLLVDNGSTDGSATVFEQAYKDEPRVKCLSLSENGGFAVGNNAALKKIDTDFVMLLNSDAYFPEGTKISSCLDYLTMHPKVGCLTPDLILRNGSRDMACHRGFPTPWNALCYFCGLERIPFLRSVFGGYHLTDADFDSIHTIDACSGAAMILRSSVLHSVGMLDERFFMYGEDLDWCYRIQKAGFSLVFFPEIRVIHDKHSSGIKKKNKKTREAFYDAMRLFYQKHDVGPAYLENSVLFGIWLLSKIRI